MNRETIVLFENFCRTCMIDDKKNESGKTKFISVFNHPDILKCKSVTIMDLLLLTVPKLNVDSGDRMPKILCENCLESLKRVYKFQKMCVAAEQSFRLMIQEAYRTESESIKDPLTDSIKDISVGNFVESLATKDLSNFPQTELDEPLIDENESLLCSKTATNDSDTKFEMNHDLWQDTSDSDSKTQDSVIELDSSPNIAKRKNSSKADVIKEDKVLETSSEKMEIKQTIDESKTLNSILYYYSKQNESGKFCCDVCGNHLKTRKNLMRHKKIHLRNAKDVKESGRSSVSSVKDNGNKKFVCDECGSRFSFNRNLKRHKQIHLKPVVEGERNLLIKANNKQCKFCKKVYHHMEDHLRTHTGERPYLCAECGKAFKTQSSMREHLLRHGTDRKFICPNCPKKFICHTDLAAHKASHNKKLKPNVCDICGAAFRKPSCLKKHKMYHTGEKNHKCDYCEMRFVLAEQCRRHMRTHTGEKPFKCKYCERGFAQSGDLIKHLRVHLGDNVYICDLCPQKFRLRKDLRVHFSSHKNDDEETKERNLQTLKDEEQRLQMKFGLVNSM